MKKGVCFLVLILFCNFSFSKEISRDSIVKKPKVAASLFLSAAGGLQKYSELYYTRVPASKAQILVPFDLRFYFLKNHLGLGYSRLPSIYVDGGSLYNPMTVRKSTGIKTDNIFFISHNFNLPFLETKKLFPYFQINHGVSTIAGYIVFGTAGVQYKFTKNIAINMAVNIGTGNNFEKYDLNLGVCFRAIQPDNEKKRADSVAVEKQRFYIEIGAGLYTSRNQTDFSRPGKSYGDLYIDTIDYYENDFVTVRRSFPSFVAGFTKENHSVQIEGSRVSHSASMEEGYYNGSEIEKSEEFYLSLGYYHNDIFAFLKKTERRDFTIFGGVKLLFVRKSRAINQSDQYNYLGNGADEQIHHSFESKCLKILPETVLRWQFQRHLFIKLGLSFNTFGYIKGHYKFDYQLRKVNNFDVYYTNRQKDEDYRKFLLPGTLGNFRYLDNVFLKLGYSF